MYEIVSKDSNRQIESTFVQKGWTARNVVIVLKTCFSLY